MTEKKTIAPKKPAAQALAKAPSASAAPRKERPVARVNVREETRARNKKALEEALALACSVRIEPPVVPVSAVKAADAKPAKAKKAVAKKARVVRDRFTMPEADYALIFALKKRISRYGGSARKSELLRAGLALLAGLNDVELTAAMSEVEPVNTKRPRK